MDLVRQILQRVEALEWVNENPPEPYQAGTAEEAYQIALMKDAGLLEAFMENTNGSPSAAAVFRLTWAGHEFLDAARDDKVWKKAKELVLKPGLSWTFQILGDFLKSEIQQRLLGSPQP
jgi:hypothetical protein